MNILSRETSINSANDECDSELADKASSVLGYSVGRDDRAMRTAAAPIIEWLKERDIAPFSEQSVKRYMLRKRLLSEVKTRYTRIAPAIAMLVISIVVGFNSTWVDPTAGSLGSLGIGLLAIITGCTTFTQRSWEWEAISISRYERPIPEFALQTAVDVVEAFPDLSKSIYVFELRQKERPIYADPFLAISVSFGQTLYLEVWNEPGFKKTREV